MTKTTLEAFEADPELQILDGGSDLSQADRDAADAAADAAFALAFSSETPIDSDVIDMTGKTTPTDVTDPAKVATVATETTAATAPVVDDKVVEDPFAGLSQHARELLAKVPQLEAELSTTKGRVGALQRENAELKRKPAADTTAPAAKAPAEKLERVRGELPEVAEAIEEAFERLSNQRATAEQQDDPKQTDPATAQPTQATTVDPVEQAMAEAHADWAQVATSQEFKLYVASLPDAERTKISSTDNPAVFSGAITAFKVQRDRTTRQLDDAARRNKRVSSAVAPTSSGRRPPDTNMSEHDAFLAGFNS